ncbi:m7GpppX diphosphatase isoform X2 [Anabrus simplex]|uniref:m7GpppX diphosphatase isoform X2 n=1 Tax=Anabrus simplex TaxID=316456 RepID=UPI0035A30F7B
MADNASVTQDDAPDAKRMKSESLTSECRTDSIHSSLSDFSSFELQRVLNENAQRKTVFIQGSFKERKGQAIVILEKTPFDEKSIDGILSANSRLKRDFSNDIYGNYECYPEIQFNNIKATIIHPATEKHIQKYESQPVHIIDETPEFYHTLTLPHLQKEQFNLQWVTNIIEHKSEVERIVFEDTDPETGFILLPDLKWDAKQVENLYLVAIVRKTGISSLRSLTGDHLNLLKNLQAKGIKRHSTGMKRSGKKELKYFYEDTCIYEDITDVEIESNRRQISYSRFPVTCIPSLSAIILPSSCALY